LAGLSNTYTHYITTFEEYEKQRYEAASTIYGPHTLLAYLQQVKRYFFVKVNTYSIVFTDECLKWSEGERSVRAHSLMEGQNNWFLDQLVGGSTT
jgi:hypothetical protein